MPVLGAAPGWAGLSWQLRGPPSLARSRGEEGCANGQGLVLFHCWKVREEKVWKDLGSSSSQVV